ncbi:tartrate-resistant acid phosphatase type 5-like [Haliotis asinina]|uniref:tartrate-resistant acid phosphatase type 5-like n=1 Tax=Haliotis asinina TaxID=109174 RepID=UPI003531D0A2
MVTVPFSLVLLALAATGCLAADNTLRFIVIGDNGGADTYPYTTPLELGTADRMAMWAQKVGGIHFVMELGDNFYDYGIKDVDDARFQNTFEDVYTAPSLQVPWYIVAGNHDHRGNVSAEIMYSKKSNKWRFPDFYYPLRFNIPNSNATIDFVMIDTVVLCGQADDVILHPEGPEDVKAAASQWIWIDQQLRASKATYLFTAGHYPVLSIAEHGPTLALVAMLQPLLYKHRASGHMSGHDHNLQHLQEAKDGVTLDFILSGCADKMDTSEAHKDSVPEGSSKFHWADPTSMGGFVYVEASAEKMVSTFISAEGDILYNTTTYPRELN